MITATHGSGHKYKVLTSRVTEFDLVLPDGALKTLNALSTPNFGHYLINFGSDHVYDHCSRAEVHGEQVDIPRPPMGRPFPKEEFR
jgi:hypothetical protein